MVENPFSSLLNIVPVCDQPLWKEDHLWVFTLLHPSVGILNGMGTKGCSLAPYFAKQLTDHLVYQIPVAKDADIKRFEKILTRS